DEKTDIRRECNPGLRDNFTLTELFDRARKLRRQLSIIGKLDRANTRRGRFHIRRKREGIMKQNLVDQFFLRSSACFHDETWTSRQPLARGHAFAYAGVFRSLVKLNDPR